MPASVDLVGRLLAGRYRIDGLIGRGASARVYVAEDLQLERPVAVKVLHEALAGDAAFLKRFRAEALAAARLNHPNVMHVYDSGTGEIAGASLPFLVCELLGGGSLRDLLDTGARLTPSQALVVGLETARGLEYAHGQGFVHRDIKPANLLFGEDARLRIADFGLARALAEAAWTEPQGTLLGTARYASPEQARGESVDGRSDIYSLGIVLTEAVTGDAPFAADTPAGMLMARTRADVVVPDELGRLRPVLERCGRLDPDQRPDAGELAIAFLAASEEMDRPAMLPLAMLTVRDSEPEPEPAPEPDEELGTAQDQDVGHDEMPVGQADAPSPSKLDDTELVDLPGAHETRSTGEPDPTVAIPTVDIELSGDEDTTDPLALEDEEANGPGPAGARCRRWPKVLVAVVLLVALGAGGWFAWSALAVPSHPVPKLVGLQLDEATALVKGRRWKVDDSTTQRRDGTEPGEVLAQRPAPGSDLEEGRTVRLTVSAGNTLVDVPPVTGLAEADALTKLQEAGVTAQVGSRPNDETVPKGVVISQAAPADLPGADEIPEGKLPRGTQVTLTVSDGPQPRTIPAGLVGAPFDAVNAQLANLKLVVNRSDEFSDTVQAGLVLRLDPAEGATVPRDSGVAVVVSKGPEPIPIPDVTGKSGIDATNILSAAGFPVSGIANSAGQPGSPTKQVIATDPPAGEPHPRGTPVRVVTRT